MPFSYLYHGPLIICISFLYKYNDSDLFFKQAKINEAKLLLENEFSLWKKYLKHGTAYNIQDTTILHNINYQKDIDTLISNLNKINPVFISIEADSNTPQIRQNRLSYISFHDKTTAAELKERELIRQNKDFMDGFAILEPDNFDMTIYYPVKAQKSCLQCHNNEGILKDSIIGSVKIELPGYKALLYSRINTNIFRHVLVYLAGLFAMLILFYVSFKETRTKNQRHEQA